MKLHRRGLSGASLVLLLSLQACGGGGGGGSGGATPEPPTATPVPDTLAITAPASIEAGADTAFGSSAAAAAGLSFEWRFGDGATSTAAAPQHRYERAGSFEVVLRLSNAASQSREARATVKVSSDGNVQGLICGGGAGRGWCWQRQQPTAHRVRDVVAITPQTAWAVGQFGEILKTSDGGAHWTLQREATDTGSLEAVSFLDAQVGWAVGAAGVFRTTDGGASWQRRDPASSGISPFQPEEVRVFDAQTALVRSGYQGIATRDGGASWRLVNPVEAISPTGALWDTQFFRLNRADVQGLNRQPVLDLQAQDICGLSTYFTFASASRLFLNVLSQNCTPGPAVPPRVVRQTLWRSDDGGGSWVARDLAPLGLFSQLLWASGDESLLLASFSGSLYRSVDDGLHWAVMTGAPYPMSGTVLGLGGQNVVLFNGEQAHYSADAGLSWKPSTLPTGRRFGSDAVPARRIDANSFTLRASNGDFWMSRDRGASFQRLIGHTEVELNLQYSLAVLGAKQVRMLAFDRTMQQTQDGGQTWTVLESGLGGFSTGPGLQKLQFLNASVGWRLLTDGVIYRTEDGGATWQPTPILSATTFYFADASRGWARQPGQGLMLTDDGGRQWRRAAGLPEGIHVLRYPAGGRIVGVGPADFVVVSADNGQTWQRRPWSNPSSSGLTTVAVHPGGSLWATGLGATLIRSTDGGDNWARVALPADVRTTLNDIVFVDASNGWIVGNAGVILATKDGGTTWSKQKSGTPLDLHTVQFSDPRTGWITGAQGLLLATSTGGD